MTTLMLKFTNFVGWLRGHNGADLEALSDRVSRDIRLRRDLISVNPSGWRSRSISGSYTFDGYEIRRFL
jgi:hypothetical protein